MLKTIPLIKILLKIGKVMTEIRVEDGFVKNWIEGAKEAEGCIITSFDLAIATMGSIGNTFLYGLYTPLGFVWSQEGVDNWSEFKNSLALSVILMGLTISALCDPNAPEWIDRDNQDRTITVVHQVSNEGELFRLEAELTKVEEKNNELSSELLSTKNDLITQLEANDELASLSSEIESQNQELIQERNELKEQVEELKKNEGTPTDSHEEIEQLKNELAQLKQNRTLEQVYKMKSGTDLKTHQETNETLKRKIKVLKEQLSTAKKLEQTNNELKLKADRLQQQVNTLRQQKENFEKTIQELKELHIKNYNQVIEEKKQLNEQLRLSRSYLFNKKPQKLEREDTTTPEQKETINRLNKYNLDSTVPVKVRPDLYGAIREQRKKLNLTDSE